MVGVRSGFILALLAALPAGARAEDATECSAARPRALTEPAAATPAPQRCAPRSAITMTADREQLFDNVVACGGRLASCANTLLGNANVTIAKGVVDVVLSDADAALVRNRISAGDVVGSTAEQVEIPYDRRLTQITGGTSLRQTAEDATHGALGADERDLMTRWSTILAGLDRCGELQSATSAGGQLTPESIADLSAKLMCTFRLAGDLPRHAVLPVWPGERCEQTPPGRRPLHDGRTHVGVIVAGVCVAPNVPADHFPDTPIDERMPGLIADVIARLNGRLPSPWKVSRLGLIGCGEERLDTGQSTRNLQSKDKSKGGAPAFSASHIGDHAQGTACDIQSVSIYNAETCATKTFSMNMINEGNNAVPKISYRNALFDKLERTGVLSSPRDIYQCRRLVRHDMDGTYRRLEQGILSARQSFTDLKEGDAGFEVGMGVLLRNSLVDAGLYVFDATTNDVHADHFHAELPPLDADHDALAAHSAQGLAGLQRKLNWATDNDPSRHFACCDANDHFDARACARAAK